MTTTKICVDANFIVRLISSDPPYSPIEDLWNEWLDSGYEIVAPTLMYYEVSNAFHRMSLAGQISAETAIELMESALDLGITLYGDRSLHQKALNREHPICVKSQTVVVFCQLSIVNG